MIGKSFLLRAEVCRALNLSSSNRTAPALAKGALAVCAALSPLAGFAQESTPAEKTLATVKIQDEGEPAPAVTQIGRTPQLLRDVPQTISVISSETIEAQAATTLTDVLRNVPGITLSAGEGGNIGDNVNLRGFSARTDLFIDGLRDRGQYSRETAFLESVEVLKGPSSMLFGRGSTGGVINQVTKQPNRREFTQVGGSAGTDAYYRVTADVNQPFAESAAFRLTAFGHTNESTRDVVESERYGIAPSVRFGIGTPTEIAINAIVQRRDDLPDYGFPVAAGTVQNPGRPIDVDRDNFYGYTDDYFRQDVDIVGVRLTHEFSPAFTLRNQTQFNSARIEARPTTINSAGVRNPRRREIDDHSLFNQTDLIVRLGEGSIRHVITAGAEIGRDDFENQTYTTTAGATPFTQNLDAPVYGPVPADAVVAPNTFSDNVGKTIAVYANEQLELGDHWKVVLGLRWDRFEFESESTVNATGVTTSLTQTDKMTSERAGVIYQPSEVQTYYLSYGTSFNPSAEQVTLNNANVNVDPEENRSYELGAKWSFSEGALLLTSAVFRVEKANARSTEFGVTTLEGDLRVDGFEVGLSGDITADWNALIGYTYLDGEVIDLSGVVGTVLPNTPKHTATVWTTYEFAGGWQIGGGVVHATDRFLNNANTAITDGYTRVDATVAYMATRYSIRLNVLNVTDEEYFEVASAGRATPAQSLSALASFNWRF